ncbi:zinc knuckle CX2CX4HX4C containing protein [Tanacetum coccineum]
MEKNVADSLPRKINPSLVKNVDGKIIGKDGKPLKSALRVPKSTSNVSNESLAVANKSSSSEYPSLSSIKEAGKGAANDVLKESREKEVSSQESSKQVSSDPNKMSFANIVLEQPVKKMVCIKEMKSNESVVGAAVALPFEAVEAVNARFVNTLVGYFIGDRLAYPLVESYVKNSWAKYGLKRIQMHGEFFLFQFNSRDGLNNVLENGPWLIRRVPLILSEWSPNTILKKDEIKAAPVWVKMHHVPIVAYSEVGLSLITSQIGKPLMLDTYTSNMCLHSWGRSSYARALIEISALTELKESLVVAIPLANKEGHSLATIDIEYEWTPPRCDTCKIFDHVNEKCPKLPKVMPKQVVDEDGFKEVKSKKNKQAAKKQVAGIKLSKPNLNLQYRRVEPKLKKDDNKNGNQESSSSGVVSKPDQPGSKVIKMNNTFSSLEDYDTDWESGGTQRLDIIDSDSEEVDEEINLEEPNGQKKNSTTGASTPDVTVS